MAPAIPLLTGRLRPSGESAARQPGDGDTRRRGSTRQVQQPRGTHSRARAARAAGAARGQREGEGSAAVCSGAMRSAVVGPRPRPRPRPRQRADAATQRTHVARPALLTPP